MVNLLTTVVLNTKSGVELLRYEQDEWDIDALKQQTDYFTLTRERLNAQNAITR